MAQVLMIAPRFRKDVCRCGPVALLAASLLLAASACEKVPLLAPTGSTITLTASASTLPIGGSTTILALVVRSSGAAPHSGTQVSFTTNLGSVTPAQASTDVNGRVLVTFNAGNQSGTATINATSGGATTGTTTTTGSTTTTGAVKIAIGAAAVGRVVLSANPASVSSFGGSTTITAAVVDTNGNALGGVPVTFTSTAGSLSQGVVNTDQNGNAQTTLTTSQQATVTATVGTQTPSTGTGSGSTTGTTTTSATVTVNVIASPTIVISPPSSAPSEGLPSSYTFAVTAPSSNGSTIRNVHVDWADGQSQDLGAITGSVPVSHVYQSAGNYPISATVTDVFGNSYKVSTAVTVVPTPLPTIIITPSVPTTSTPTVTVTAQVQVTAPTGVNVVEASIDWGDGQSQKLGGLNGSATLTHQFSQHGPATIALTVKDTLNRTTQGFATINVP
jgi:adhesin/invasin